MMKLNEEAPKCIVLLATFNGEKFLHEQITSIQTQIGVQSKIYFSDDCSSDTSSEICAKHGCINMNPNKIKFGSAAINFFHLIDNIELAASIEYVFLSDQDDIWKPNKMISAIKALRKTGAEAYSGSFVTCDIDGNSMRYVNKSFKQTDVDYFFRSPGPGFTFCFSRYAFEQIKETLVHTGPKKDIRWHDWFIYAQARIMTLEWFIDDRAFALYRIHEHNDTGQLSSVSQLMKRFKFLMSGSYRRQVLLMTEGSLHPLRHQVIRFNFLDKLRLITSVHRMRSKALDRLALILWSLFSKKN